MMKSLCVFVVCLFAFQALLFVSTVTAARCLPTLSLERNGRIMKAPGFGGRRPGHSPPPPPHYSPGPVQKVKKSPTTYVIGRRHSPPPPPHYSPGPTPGLVTIRGSLSLPAATSSEHRHPQALKDLIYYQNSPPNHYAASA